MIFMLIIVNFKFDFSKTSVFYCLQFSAVRFGNLPHAQEGFEHTTAG